MPLKLINVLYFERFEQEFFPAYCCIMKKLAVDLNIIMEEKDLFLCRGFLHQYAHPKMFIANVIQQTIISLR